METNIWNQCYRLLVVLPYVNEDDFKFYRNALDNLLQSSSVKELKIITVIPDGIKKDNLISHKLIHYLKPKELSFFKKLKDEALQVTLAQPYDVIMWFELNDRKVYRLISEVQCKWKIGVNTPMENLDIKVSCDSTDKGEIINFAKKTLEKIT